MKERLAEPTTRKNKRLSRNRARYHMMKAGRAHTGDGKDVHHRNGNAIDNSAGNLAVVSRAKNLRLPRKKRSMMSR